MEYIRWLSKLPKECPNRDDFIDQIEKEMGIKEIDEKSFNFRNFTLIQQNDSMPLMDELSAELGIPHRVMVPPVTQCIYCHSKLQYQHGPTPTLVHTLTGPYLYAKYITRYHVFIVCMDE